MRFLMFHVTRVKYKVKSKGRSRVIEDKTPENREGEMENAMLLLVAMEKKDESRQDEVLTKATNEIKHISSQISTKNVMLISFAHLFVDLSSPEFAFDSLKKLEAMLKKEGFSVNRAPFGWFNTLDIEAKGHPLSRMAREF